MDDRQFDELTRSVMSTRSRRDALRLLAGAALGLLGLKTEPVDARRACPRGKERCQGRCVPVCRDVKQRNRQTCECECPERMKDCGRRCVGQDRCCPGERRCASGGCVPRDACCHDEQRCFDGSCRPKEGGECCPNERPCDGQCISAENCCPSTERQCPSGACIPRGTCCTSERECADGSCVAAGACCPGEKQCPNGSCAGPGTCCPSVEVPCASAPGGCCNFFAGEVCSDDGCCNELAGMAVCGGKCVDATSDPNNCGGCGVTCGRCQTCSNGICRGPDRSTCETCVSGEVKPGVQCGDHCCPAGAECCGGGCCAPGNCVSQNGGTCCRKVIDNRPYCLRM